MDIWTLLCRAPVSQFSIPGFYKLVIKKLLGRHSQSIMMCKGLFLATVRLSHPLPLFFNRVLVTRDLFISLDLVFISGACWTDFFCLSNNLLCLHSDAHPSVCIFFWYVAVHRFCSGPFTSMHWCCNSNLWHSGSHLWIKYIYPFSGHKWVCFKNQVLSLYFLVSLDSVLPILGLN